MSPSEKPDGAIYDLGYRHYDGVRLGRAGAVRALYVEGIWTLFGIGRGFRAKIPPIALMVFVVLPALIQAAIVGLVGPGIQVFSHQTYFSTTVWVFGLFCAFQTPELVTGDQQYRVLALYFSRAINRWDYLLARFAALSSSLFIVALLPHIVLLLGSWFSSADVYTAISDSLPLIPRIIFASLAISILMSTVSLAIAGVIQRRPFATGAILGVFLLSSLFVAPLVGQWPVKMRHALLASPTWVGDGVSRWIFDSTSLTATIDTVVLFGPMPDPLPPTATKDDSTAYTQQVRQRRRRRNNRSLPQLANLPGLTYLEGMLGYLVVAGVILTLRYRRIET